MDEDEATPCLNENDGELSMKSQEESEFTRDTDTNITLAIVCSRLTCQSVTAK